MFAFDGKLTMVSYMPQKGNNVMLLSTMHHDAKTGSGDRRPDIIVHYNACKNGVDNMDSNFTKCKWQEKARVPGYYASLTA